MNPKLYAFLIATLVALVLRFFFIEDFRVVSKSMEPALMQGDLVFSAKFAYNLKLPFSTYEVVRWRDPKYGEVVAFNLPDKNQESFVKRVVGLAGDKIAIKKGVLYINGVPSVYAESSAGETEKLPNQVQYEVLRRSLLLDFGPIDIPKEHFFVLGDNREDSLDSRTWGPIPLSYIKGKLFLVWLSIAPPSESSQWIRWNRMATWVR